MIFLWVPETKQRTLEELDYIFAVPTRTHMGYQMRKALPYFFHRWILRRKDAVLEPLYQFDSARENDESRIADLHENDRRRAELRKDTSTGADENAEKAEKGKKVGNKPETTVEDKIVDEKVVGEDGPHELGPSH
jgi:hypothetical protein